MAVFVNPCACLNTDRAENLPANCGPEVDVTYEFTVNRLGTVVQQFVDAFCVVISQWNRTSNVAGVG